MAIQIGTVDGLITISKNNFNCFISAIYTFSQQGGVEYAVQKGVSLGTAFQRYVEPVYTRRTNRFDIASIDTPVYTRAGNEQSPARGTFCRKMGILDINDRSNIFQLTPLALELYRNNITIEEYAFILMTKQGIFNNGIYVQNLFAFIANWFDKNTTLLESDLKSAICGLYGNQDIEKTRIDIILNALSLCNLIVNVGTGKYVLASIPAADIFKDFALHSKYLSQALRDDENNYTDYIGSLDHGIFDIISNKNSHIYSRIYPNLSKYIKQNMDKTHQIIYYGAPGTGKSHNIKEELEGVSKENIFRTTFHPDSDYSTFVGAYKPSRGKKPLYGLNGGLTVRLNNGEDLNEEIITYKFIPQAFLNAYVRAYSTTDNVYLVIEEINRGNCAQIFGDLFQLLDRDEKGVSEYTIKADTDLKEFLIEELGADSGAIKDGELCLPSNLYIYATMNTSDQSLFPIDSAFKRRWDWKYRPIVKGRDKDGSELNWRIKADTKEYDWWSFLEKINAIVGTTTNSEDKKLGFFFCKPTDSVISAETFVGKVIFYLWNDVFKNFGFDDPIFKDEDGSTLEFDKFYTTNIYGDTIVRTDKVERFLENLKVKVAGEIITEVEDEDGNTSSTSIRDYTKYSINGVGRYGKNSLAAECVKEYIKLNSDMLVEDVLANWKSLGNFVPHFIESKEEHDARTDKSDRFVEIPCGDTCVYVERNGYGNNGAVDKLIAAVHRRNWNIKIDKVE